VRVDDVPGQDHRLGAVGPPLIAPADLDSGDVLALVQRHLAFARAHTPSDYVHAVGAEALADPTVTLFCARVEGRPVAIGALRELDNRHGELKSMHTAVEVRGTGVGRAMVAHLVDEARRRGYTRVSLETGTSDAFDPARRLYAAAGFEPCGPFSDYPDSGHNFFMTMPLG
jgi:putative acetyltransferase